MANRDGTRDPLLTVRQLAHAEGLKERQVRYLIDNCDLPAYRVAGVRIRRSEYSAWLERRRVRRGKR